MENNCNSESVGLGVMALLQTRAAYEERGRAWNVSWTGTDRRLQLLVLVRVEGNQCRKECPKGGADLRGTLTQIMRLVWFCW